MVKPGDRPMIKDRVNKLFVILIIAAVSIIGVSTGSEKEIL